MEMKLCSEWQRSEIFITYTMDECNKQKELIQKFRFHMYKGPADKNNGRGRINVGGGAGESKGRGNGNNCN